MGFFTAFQRRAAGNFGIHQNKRGFAGLLGLTNGICNGVDIIAVYIVDGMPAIGTVPRRDIFAEGNRGVTLNGDAVAVVQDDEFIQLLRAGKGAGLGGNAFLQAAVSYERIGIMIYNREALFVEFGGQMGFRHCHTNCHTYPLAQRPGGGLNTSCMAVFGMPGRGAVPLAE